MNVPSALLVSMLDRIGNGDAREEPASVRCARMLYWLPTRDSTQYTTISMANKDRALDLPRRFDHGTVNEHDR